MAYFGRPTDPAFGCRAQRGTTGLTGLQFTEDERALPPKPSERIDAPPTAFTFAERARAALEQGLPLDPEDAVRLFADGCADALLLEAARLRTRRAASELLEEPRPEDLDRLRAMNEEVREIEREVAEVRELLLKLRGRMPHTFARP